jgi:glycosyltransferase involved in cell wall biosynthesis
MKIKLLQVMLNSGTGGAQTFFEKMVFAFEEIPQITQHVVTVQNENRLNQFAPAGLSMETVPAGNRNFRLFPRSISKIQRELIARKLLNTCRRFKPDIILTHHVIAPTMVRYKDAIHIARLGSYFPIQWYKTCDWLVCNHPQIRHHVVGKGWPKDKVEIISNFPDFPTDAIPALPLPELPPDAVKLLTLGRLGSSKAQDTLIEAAALLPDNFHVLIAGDGKLETSLRALAEKLNIGHRVHFLGFRCDTAHLLQFCDIVIFPSRIEPLGNVTIEAWQAKKPLIAANNIGTSWLVEDGEQGLLFPIDDANALADKINLLHSNPDLVRRIVAGGTRKLEAEFSREIIISQYLSLFDRLIQQKKLK